MDQYGNLKFCDGTHRFRNVDELEEFCFFFPEYEDVVESACDDTLRIMVDTYYAAAELDYGDGSVELPIRQASGRYGDIFIETEDYVSKLEEIV